MLAQAETYCDLRFEKIDGQVYAMASASVNHSEVASNLTNVFKRYLLGRTCRAFREIDVFMDEDNVIPDVMIVCDKDKIKPNGIHGAPDLVVEILSPSTGRQDRIKKFKLYERNGVKEYWLIDPNSKMIEIYLLEEGRFELEGFYSIVPDDDQARKPEEYRLVFPDMVVSPTFPDMPVSLQEVFLDVE